MAKLHTAPPPPPQKNPRNTEQIRTAAAMKILAPNRLAMLTLLACTLCMTSSCQMIAPLLSMPLKLAGGLLSMFSANPIGTAAAAAML